MEQQLAESPWSALAMASEAPNGQQQASPAANGSAKDIMHQSEEQRKIRLNDAKLVEAKAAKIKEWVTNKLREVTKFFLFFHNSPLVLINRDIKRKRRARKLKFFFRNFSFSHSAQLEEQNRHLREQNQKCNEQLQLLRNRLRQVSQASGRASTEVPPHSSCPF